MKTYEVRYIYCDDPSKEVYTTHVRAASLEGFYDTWCDGPMCMEVKLVSVEEVEE